MSMSGEVAEAELHYIVRDHDKDLFEAKKKTLKLIEKDMNEKMGRRHCSAYNFRAVPQHGRDHCYLYAPDRQCEKKRVRMQMWHHLYFRSAAVQTAVS